MHPTDNLLSRLELLEQRVAELSRPPLYREPVSAEIVPWLADLQRAHAFAGERVHSATIRIRGEIDAALREQVEADLWSKRTAQHLDIMIDSEGGDYYQSMALYRAIRWAPALSRTAFFEAHCSSGAILIAMAAERRVARADTNIVLHLVGSYPEPNRRWTAADHAEAVRRQSALDRSMLSLIADRTGADFDELVREAINEHPSTLEWCRANGLVHEVSG